MRYLLGFSLMLIVLAAPNKADAQRYRRDNGMIMTPDGPIRNATSSAEWRQAGGNYDRYLEIMQQKAMVAQSQAYQKQYQAAQKQQAAFEKWVKDQKAKQEKGKPVDPAYQQMLDQQARYKAAVEAQAARVAAKKAKKKSSSQTKKADSTVDKTSAAPAANK